MDRLEKLESLQKEYEETLEKIHELDWRRAELEKTLKMLDDLIRFCRYERGN